MKFTEYGRVTCFHNSLINILLQLKCIFFSIATDVQSEVMIVNDYSMRGQFCRDGSFCINGVHEQVPEASCLRLFPRQRSTIGFC